MHRQHLHLSNYSTGFEGYGYALYLSSPFFLIAHSSLVPCSASGVGYKSIRSQEGLVPLKRMEQPFAATLMVLEIMLCLAVLVAQSYSTVCYPIVCSPPGFSKNTGGFLLWLLDFPRNQTWVSLHSYHLSHQGSLVLFILSEEDNIIWYHSTCRIENI